MSSYTYSKLFASFRSFPSNKAYLPDINNKHTTRVASLSLSRSNNNQLIVSFNLVSHSPKETQIMSTIQDLPTNYYTILKLPITATEEDIRASYKDEAKRLHPDKRPNDPKATSEFQLVSPSLTQSLTLPLLCLHHNK